MTCDTKKILAECHLGPLTPGYDYPRGWSLCSMSSGAVRTSPIDNRDTAKALAAATQAVPVLCEELNITRAMLSGQQSALARVVQAYEERHAQYGITVVAGNAIRNAITCGDLSDHELLMQRYQDALEERDRTQVRLDAALAAYRGSINTTPAHPHSANGTATDG